MKRMIDLQITSRCNLNCKFCDGAPKDIADTPFSDVRKVIDKLKKSNVKRIVITGGEPLLYNEIDNLIEYIKNMDIEIYLSTNGYFLEKHIDTIINNVSCIGLPLDASSPKICELMTRKENQISTTLKAIEIIKSKKPNIVVKVGTVVSKINIDEIDKIYNLLISLKYKPDVWRLYEFSPLGIGEKNRQKFEISTSQFISSTQKYLNSTEMSVSRLSNESSNDAYIFLHPNMDVVLLTNDKYKKVGNILKMSDMDVEKLFCDEQLTLKNQQENRQWLEREN